MAALRSRPVSSTIPKRSEEHTSELQSHLNLVCRLLLEKKKIIDITVRLNHDFLLPPSDSPGAGVRPASDSCHSCRTNNERRSRRRWSPVAPSCRYHYAS